MNETNGTSDVAVTRPDGRTAAGREAKRLAETADQAARAAARAKAVEASRYHDALALPEVSGAIRAASSARARRDSVSGKLCGGSVAVSVQLLAELESELSTAQQSLFSTFEKHPVLRNADLAALL